MRGLKKIVDALLQVHEKDQAWLAQESDIDEDRLERMLVRDDVIPSDQDIMDLAVVLKVSRNHLLGLDLLTPQVAIPCRKTVNGYWGVVSIQIKGNRPFDMYPISMATAFSIEQQMLIFKDKPGILVFPDLAGSVMFVYTDRISEIQLLSAEDAMPDFVDQVGRDKIQRMLEEYPFLTMLSTHVQRINDTSSTLLDASTSPGGTKTFLDKLDLDEDDVMDLWNSYFRIFYADGKKGYMPMNLLESPDVFNFCLQNMGVAGKFFDTVVPWNDNGQLELPNIDPTSIKSYESYRPALLRYTFHDARKDCSCPAFLNMANAAVLQIYLPDLELAYNYIMQQKKQQD